ncbi:MAG: FAD:protein FMN transferase [Lachnospiraceae bacterium]|nr:FAD:protein FMN transferase [Lachnospiraceae bacterium]
MLNRTPRINKRTVSKAMLRIMSAAWFLMLFLISGCGKGSGVNSSTSTFMMLDTVITVTVYGTEDQAYLDDAVDAATEECRYLEGIFSASDEGSELYRLNETAYGNDVPVSDHLYTVIERALYYAELSDGCFDPSIGRLIALWGIGTDHAAVPDAGIISELAGRENYKSIILDPEKKTVRFTEKDTRLDLGAIAKGYIGDRMLSVLKEKYGLKSVLLNLGGNVIASEENLEKGRPWTVAVADPEDRSKSMVTLEITDRALVTSGTYERYFEEGGKVYHHLLDPFTGYPAETGLLSVTILADNSTDADALSTAVFVMGPEKGMMLIDSLENVECIMITDDRELIYSKGLREEISGDGK